MSTPLLARVALAHLAEPGNRDMGILVDIHGPIDALARLKAGDIPHRLLRVVSARLAAADPLETAARLVERTDQLGGRIIVPEDDEWPTQVDDLRRISVESPNRADRDVYPPLCMWVRGPMRLDDAVGRSVALIGARASSAYGNHVAADLAYGLAGRAWHVVSGGAFGIDAQAHRGAVAGGGVTVAVLACGVDRPYPMAHAGLFERIMQDGLLLSEWPPGAEPHRHRFLTRNRVIAALTRGTVVVEASARSGARQTANRAARLGRAVMAVPGPITSATSVGTHQMLRELGTRLVTSPAEIIEEVGHIGELADIERGPERERDRLDPDVARILDAIPLRDGAGPAQIAAVAGVPLREALQTLPYLALHGLIVEDSGRWRLAPRART